jgi:hypothetical protein
MILTFELGVEFQVDKLFRFMREGRGRTTQVYGGDTSSERGPKMATGPQFEVYLWGCQFRGDVA